VKEAYLHLEELLQSKGGTDNGAYEITSSKREASKLLHSIPAPHCF
jgi:hypothetical protein